MTARTYANFDLLVEATTEGRFRARVTGSPVAEGAVTTFELPFEPTVLENLLLRLDPGRSGTRRGSLNPQVQAGEQFGGALFDAVFAADVGLEWARSQDKVTRTDGLRLRLRLDDAPSLAALPWELLYEQRPRTYIAQSERTPVVRFLQVPEPLPPLAIDGPLRILVVISSPTDLPELDVEAEWGRVRRSLAGRVDSGLVVVDRLEQPTVAALGEWLRRRDVHVLHFIGHGDFDDRMDDGVVYFCDGYGRSAPVTSSILGPYVHDHDPLRLVVLNACRSASVDASDPYGGMAQGLVQQRAGAVVAMQFPISDRAAVTFTGEFYGAMADGLPVDQAVTSARKLMRADFASEWATPVLFLRAADGRIFDGVLASGPASGQGAPVTPSDPAPVPPAPEATSPETPVPEPDDRDPAGPGEAEATPRDSAYAVDTGPADDGGLQVAGTTDSDARPVTLAMPIPGALPGALPATVPDVDPGPVPDVDPGRPSGPGAAPPRGPDTGGSSRSRTPFVLGGAGLVAAALVAGLVIHQLGDGSGGDGATGTTTQPTVTQSTVTHPTTTTPPTTPSTTSAPTTVQTQPGSAVVAEAFATPPTIDGRDTEWGGRTAYASDHVVFGSATSPPVTASWRLGWDPTYYYLYVVVTDPTITQTHAGDPSQLWNGDSVSFELGTYAAEVPAGRLLSGDQHVIIGPTEDGGGVRARNVANARTIEPGPAFTAGDVAVVPHPGGYAVEAAIPWSALGVADAAPGTQLATNLNVSDAFPSGSRRGALRTMSSNNPGRTTNDPSKRFVWGTLTLEGS